MEQVTVDLGARAYPVLIGAGLLGDEACFRPVLGAASLVVTSKAVAALHLAELERALVGTRYRVLTLEDGESTKRLHTIERIAEAAVDAGVGRDGTLIALGGGAIGDVTGLAAALLYRGIGIIHAPTTLLAQVDSAIGGKTAVNLSSGKNLLGAFHQPRRVICDIGVLATLPDRELRAGLGEVVKYAILDGEPLFSAFEAAIPRLLARDGAALQDVVARCCAIKARYVVADETDLGLRAQLNLGHTFGHALETTYGGRLSHGEAVALGCVMSARMSQATGRLEHRDYTRIVSLVSSAGLPIELPSPRPRSGDVLAAMSRDKKVAAGAIRLVLLRGLGDAELSDAFAHAQLVHTLREFADA